jgi:hypothetical protein
MARTSPAAKFARIANVLRAWQNLGAASSFSNMSLAQFKTAVKPNFDARDTIANLKSQLRMAISKRDAADAAALELIYRIGYAVQGDPRYGRDSALFEAMGYTREIERRRKIAKGRRRKRQARERSPSSP